MTKFVAGIAAAAMLAAPTMVIGDSGKKLSQADFEACHQQAMQVAGVEISSPAASPGAGVSGSGTGATTGSTTDTTTSTSPSVGAGTSTTQPGTSGLPGTGTSPSAGVSGASADDSKLDSVVQAYRDCLKQRM